MWLLLTAFVGLNLLQSSVTRFCPAALVFADLGIRAGPVAEGCVQLEDHPR